jgi:exonuclease SbcD
VRILHTSDWHVGKTIRGEPRLAEHAAVLGEITEIATA